MGPSLMPYPPGEGLAAALTAVGSKMSGEIDDAVVEVVAEARPEDLTQSRCIDQLYRPRIRCLRYKGPPAAGSTSPNGRSDT